MLVDDAKSQQVDRSVTGLTHDRTTAEQQAITGGERKTERGAPLSTTSTALRALTVPTTTGRMPVVIPGSGKKVEKVSSARLSQSPKRMAVHVTIAVILLVVVVGTLAAVLPTHPGNASGTGHIFQPVTQSVSNKSNVTALIAAQAATATAVTHDGYEANGAGGHRTWAGVQNTFTLPGGTTTASIPSAPVQTQQTLPTPTPVPASPSGPTSISTGGGLSSPSTGTLATNFYDPFTAGQCTYWADYEYHRLAGYAVTWSGNAQDWAAGAASAGWVVSSTPHLYSIIVLQGGVQGAGAGTGHVAVVEKINSDGSVATTNWNVVGWGVFSWGTYSPGPGVSFIYHP